MLEEFNLQRDDFQVMKRLAADGIGAKVIAKQFKTTLGVVKAALWTPQRSTGYLLFTAVLRMHETATFEGLGATAAARYVSSRWNKLPEEQKGIFQTAASQQTASSKADQEEWDEAIEALFLRTQAEKDRREAEKARLVAEKQKEKDDKKKIRQAERKAARDAAREVKVESPATLALKANNKLIKNDMAKSLLRAQNYASENWSRPCLCWTDLMRGVECSYVPRVWCVLFGAMS